MSSSSHRSSSTNHLPIRLRALAANLWWTWNPEAQQIFKELSPLVWRYSNHSAIAVMQEISDQELAARLQDPPFAKRVRAVIEEFDEYMSPASTWVSRHAPALKDPVAYFSAEFGLHESLPIYSGGLGVLAGDHTKSASDLGLPFIGISLLYRQGYFKQRINPHGWQEELYPTATPESLPLELILQPEGGRLLNSVEIGHSTVFFQTWRLRVGRATLYLLDTNLPENESHYQGLTSTVYGGNIDTRIGQEIVLGIGGTRFLQSMGIKPSVYHMNEGHSAFLTLELLQRELKNSRNKQHAEQRVKASCIFTTHTPVPAGHDRFSADLMYHTLGRFWSASGLSFDDFLAYGRVNPADGNEQFTMTVLALKMSRAANGVSELHGHVSRNMWKELYGASREEEVPIGHVTNGVHTPGWATHHAHVFWNQRLGFDWTDKLMEPSFWQKLTNDGLATDEEIWALRYTLRRDLVEFVRRQQFEFFQRLNVESPLDTAHVLSPDALTICFARRFATYKRAPLIFRQLETIIPILKDPQRPVQLIFAGKAHPRDNEGKRFIQRIIEMTRHADLIGRVVFVENYDMNVARHLVSGADVWLNNPRRPLEASGTSGMKVLIHGGLNLSILDGWWREGFDGTNGWSIGTDAHAPEPEAQDEQDFADLLQTLTQSVIPEFYDRDAQGVPRRWVGRIRHAMATLIPRFSTDRMVSEYINNYYLDRSRRG
ncbi:MAG: alpha-glucan family phosphorylase [Bacteroidetes bacterium]|jgi:starch phosphorylase|nr:alpha-glucan family phosphorylase [Bacteroidota bacterium]